MIDKMQPLNSRCARWAALMPVFEGEVEKNLSENDFCCFFFLMIYEYITKTTSQLFIVPNSDITCYECMFEFS